jgi:hypothetical protein
MVRKQNKTMAYIDCRGNPQTLIECLNNRQLGPHHKLIASESRPVSEMQNAVVLKAERECNPA